MYGDPIAEVLLAELNLEVAKLPSAEDHSQSATRLSEPIIILRGICSLTRDVKFNIGPVRFADPGQVARVRATFVEAARRIDIGCESGYFPKECRAWAQNIRDRAEVMKGDSRCRCITICSNRFSHLTARKLLNFPLSSLVIFGDPRNCLVSPRMIV
jgi:hypothetical protein